SQQRRRDAIKATTGSFEVLIQKSQHPVEMLSSIETVAAIWNADKLIFYTLPFQFPGHLDGLFEGYVSIFVAVEQHRRRVIACDIPYGAERIERSRLLLRVVPDHFLRPKTVLAAIKIKPAPRITRSGGRSGNRAATYRHVGFLLRHGRLPA